MVITGKKKLFHWYAGPRDATPKSCEYGDYCINYYFIDMKDILRSIIDYDFFMKANNTFDQIIKAVNCSGWLIQFGKLFIWVTVRPVE